MLCVPEGSKDRRRFGTSSPPNGRMESHGSVVLSGTLAHVSIHHETGFHRAPEESKMNTLNLRCQGIVGDRHSWDGFVL